MLREMPGRVDQLLGQRHGLLEALGRDGSRPAASAPSCSDTPLDDQPQSVLASAAIVSARQPEDLADLADGAAASDNK